jgi:hypothetical protein
LGVVLFTACKSISATKFNDTIIEKENALVPQIEATEESVSTFAQENKFDSIAAVSGRMETAVEQTIAEIEKLEMPSAEGAEDFKKASVEYFQYLKSIYTGYKKLGLAKTNAERGAEIKHVQTLANKKNTVLLKMRMAQKKFASENGMKIENNKS